MTIEQKSAHIQTQILALEDEVWKFDCNAKALARAGLKERAEAVAKEAASAGLLIQAFKEQLAEIQTQV